MKFSAPYHFIQFVQTKSRVPSISENNGKKFPLSAIYFYYLLVELLFLSSTESIEATSWKNVKIVKCLMFVITENEMGAGREHRASVNRFG